VGSLRNPSRGRVGEPVRSCVVAGGVLAARRAHRHWRAAAPTGVRGGAQPQLARRHRRAARRAPARVPPVFARPPTT
jgi:hypothetical protein